MFIRLVTNKLKPLLFILLVITILFISNHVYKYQIMQIQIITEDLIYTPDCDCKKDKVILKKLNHNQISVNLVNNQNQNIINSYVLNEKEEIENSIFTCNYYNTFKRGKNLKILSYSLYGKGDLFYYNFANLVRTAKKLHSDWILRVYYDDSIDLSIKCNIECLMNNQTNQLIDNVDFCNIKQIPIITTRNNATWDATYMHAMSWRWLPIGDSFVDVFSSRSLYNWDTIRSEFNIILRWFNSKNYESHIFKGRESRANYWSFHNSININLSQNIYKSFAFGALYNNTNETFFENYILPLVNKTSKYDSLTIPLISLKKNISIFNEKLTSDEPLVKFALFSDVQYANVDGFVANGFYRYYRESIELVENKIIKWNTEENLDFIVQLGDLLDGYLNYPLNQTESSLKKCLNVLKLIHKNRKPALANLKGIKNLHVWGNHEVFSMGSKQLFYSELATARLLKQNQVGNDANYYTVDLTDRLRLICLDFFEISLLGPNRKDKLFVNTQTLINNYSKLRQLSRSSAEKDYLNRFQANNGAVSQNQLRWLRKQLEECEKLGKKVLLAGHNPVLREASDSHQSWNSEDILEVIWSFSTTVLAHVNGHIHIGILKSSCLRPFIPLSIF